MLTALAQEFANLRTIPTCSSAASQRQQQSLLCVNLLVLVYWILSYELISSSISMIFMTKSETTTDGITRLASCADTNRFRCITSLFLDSATSYDTLRDAQCSFFSR
jgi:hypothetical protein